MSLNPMMLVEPDDSIPVAVLCKDSTMQLTGVRKYYFEPLASVGILYSEMAAYPLSYPNGKATVKQIREHLGALLPNLKAYGTQYIVVNDGAYFKELTGSKKADANAGYVLPCKYEGFTSMYVLLGSNYKAFYSNPAAKVKLDQALNSLQAHIQGNYKDPGTDIITDPIYVMRSDSPIKAFDLLMGMPELELDIEAFSLKFYKAGIATIGFSFNEGAGVVFQCDYKDITSSHVYEGKGANTHRIYGKNVNNPEFKVLLKKFLTEYEGVLTYHNGNYDIKVLVYELFMTHSQDYKGMNEGIKILTRNIEDTKIIRYLATNSCAGNKLSLKEVAQEFAGNYAESDIDDIRKVHIKNLMRYNLIDCLSTRYARLKHYPEMVADQQEDIYLNIFKPSIAVLLQSELVGIPLDMPEVLRTKEELEAIKQRIMDSINTNPLVIEHMRIQRNIALVEKNLSLKRDVRTIDDFADMSYNPNSSQQTAKLLHEFLGIPIQDKTKGGAASVGGKQLKKLLNTTPDLCDHTKDLLKQLMDFADVAIIVSTFLNAFIENSVLKADGIYWLHGSFNLGGTVSGRLSSNQPNLQNIPSSGTTYAKHIKRCIKAPPGWLWVGVDFASLEDRISALTTRDPEKLKVYTDGYDGHCLRAYAYFPHRMPEIVEEMRLSTSMKESVDIINSIAVRFEDVRQDSKPPTFLLTYGGTFIGLMNNVGMSREDAKETEANYHSLYVVSDEWVKSKIVQASIDGFVTVAFGLRVRTPMLSKTIMTDSGRIPYEAQKEARTAGNALGQSYGMLNNRAAVEFQAITLASDYSTEILPCAPIHDAQYFVIRNDIEVVKWFNDNLIPCMQWQELEELDHPTVKLGGNLEIFHPTWADKVSIPNNATAEEILDLCE